MKHLEQDSETYFLACETCAEIGIDRREHQASSCEIVELPA